MRVIQKVRPVLETFQVHVVSRIDSELSGRGQAFNLVQSYSAQVGILRGI